MSASKTFKKLSAVAVTAALAMVSVNVARGVETNYYQTGFEPAARTSTATGLPDNPAVGYTATNLLGQNGWQVATTASDPAANSATVVTSTGVSGINPGNVGYYGSQIVQTTAQGGAGGSYADVYTTAANLTSTQVANYGGVVNINWDMSRAGPTGLQSRSGGFGIEVLSANQDTVLASLFLGNALDTSPAVLVEDSGGSPSTYAGYGRSDGAWGTYHISLDLNAKTFTVFVDGNTSPYTFALTAAAQAALTSEGNGIGGIAFANTNDGTDVAYYDNLQVVPEPAGVAMVGLGTLLLLAKRPKRLA
jgi:hypothetical protein